jgi:PPOX class probable F420-dependent enzyme
MAKRRDLIKMAEEEIHEFLHGRHSMSVATTGPDGRIHLIAMWYGFDGERLAFETYAKSQKVKNLERDPSITVMVEDGDQYEELRGVELVGTAEIVTDDDRKRAISTSVISRYWDFGGDEAAVEMAVANLMNKRVGIVIHPEKIVSWDHSKLGGTY